MKNTTVRPIAFVIASTNHGAMLVNRQDYLSTEKGSLGVGYQLLNRSSFDPEEIDFERTRLSGLALCVDGGR